jgi:hypothetical protein
MADRTFTVPECFQVKVMLPDGAEHQAPYGFDDFLVEFIWPYAKWNEESWMDAQTRIGEALEGVEANGPVGLALEDWEKLREAVRAARPVSRWAPKIRRMQQAVLRAC